MPDAAPIRDILNATHPQYELHKAGWAREERRAYGGDAVLIGAEFPMWRGEDATHYAYRMGHARWSGYGSMHAAVTAGHLARSRPTGANLSLGSMGELKERKAVVRGQETLAELFYYNIDGIGSNGRELPAWTDGVQQRALVTGHRWTMIEMPTLADVRRGAIATGRAATKADVLSGFRPYPVEFSPLRVPMYQIDRGRMDWAVIRVPVSRSEMVKGVWTSASEALGYYLLVRENFADLGDEYAAGGWWLFDDQYAPVAATDDAPSQGDWRTTKGEIPLFPLIGQDSQGTDDRPAMSRSLTMELDQLSVALMNRISERDYDAADAAKSYKMILGTNPNSPAEVNLTASMADAGAMIVPVPAWIDDQGNVHMPTVYDSSSGAIAGEVYRTLLEETHAAAREIMVRQITSTPDSSGASKEAGFAEATSPLLARLAANRQGWENTLIYFAELRSGATQPSGYSIWPRDFRLRDVITDVEMGLDVLKRSGLRSSTAEVNGAMTVLTERGLVAEKDQETVRGELTESANRRTQQEDADRSLFAGIKLGGGADNGGDNGDGAGAGDAGSDAAGDRAGGGEPRRGSRRDLRGTAAGEPAADRARDANGAGASGDEATTDALAAFGAQLATLGETIEGLKSTNTFDSPALRILQQMKDPNPAYRITPETAVLLLVEAGVDPETADAMVAAETPNIPPLDPPARSGNPPFTAPDPMALTALSEKVDALVDVSAKVDQITSALSALTAQLTAKPEPPPPLLDVDALAAAIAARRPRVLELTTVKRDAEGKLAPGTQITVASDNGRPRED